jgi:glucose-1-phosphate adenylyltransferase
MIASRTTAQAVESSVSRRKVLLDDVLALVLAGGQGERLKPLTRDRSKPSVPFGGIYRIIDFTLSNCLNSGLRKIYVLTQYKSDSLERHIKRGWDPLFSPELGEWIYTIPPQLRVGQRWYEGTADAVYQNFYLLQQEQPERVVILSGDHVYKMDYGKFVAYHENKQAVATIGAVEMPIEQASSFGCIEVDDDYKVSSFKEKPSRAPRAVPGRPDRVLVNMGVYCFETKPLMAVLKDDAGQETRHDFGHNILPSLISGGQLFAYPFLDENRKPTRYWRDIGTLDSYYEASMDLVAVDPTFNLYDKEWPIRTLHKQLPPAKTVFAQAEKTDGRVGMVLDSIIGNGVIVSGGRVNRSVLSPEVRVNSYARVEESVLMEGVDVGRRARVRRSIVDKGVRIPPGYVVGYDIKEDRKRFDVTKGGIVVIPKDSVLR